MDISKFNKDLGEKITKAKILEKHNDIQNAIKGWIEISEMTLKVSKRPGLEFSFRNMLINKTQQIVEHIKSLKYKSTEPIEEKIIMEEYVPIEHEMITQENERDEISINNAPKIIEDSEFKNIPKGFQEIKASKDFKIITPHNPNYVNEIMKQDINMDIFKKQEEKTIQNNIELDKISKNGNLICFACGHENPPNTKKCKNCGTSLN